MRIRTVLQTFDWRCWLGWMAATMAGVQLVAVMIFFYFAVNLADHWWGDPATVTVAGVSLGVCQWIWLRRKLVKGWWWIVSTLSGWYLALFLIKVFDVNHPNPTGSSSQLLGLIEVLAIPLAFSLPQWFLIRRQFRKASWCWIVARPLAWLTGFGLIALSDRLNILPVSNLFWSFGYDLSSLAVISIDAAIFAFGFAAVTGVAFNWIQTNQTVVPSHGDSTM